MHEDCGFTYYITLTWPKLIHIEHNVTPTKHKLGDGYCILLHTTQRPVLTDDYNWWHTHWKETLCSSVLLICLFTSIRQVQFLMYLLYNRLFTSFPLPGQRWYLFLFPTRVIRPFLQLCLFLCLDKLCIFNLWPCESKNMLSTSSPTHHHKQSSFL